MKLTWSLIALMLIAASGVALVKVSREQQGRTESVDVCRQRMTAQDDGYFAALGDWRELPLDQQLQRPWPQVVQALDLSADVIERNQLITLTAELPELVEREGKMPPFAKSLYGKDYHQKISQYRRECEHASMVVRFAVAGVCVGGILLAAMAVIWIACAVRKKPVQTSGTVSSKMPVLKAVPTAESSAIAGRELSDQAKSYDPRRDIDIDDRWTSEKDEALKAQKEVWARAQSLAAKAKGVPVEADDKKPVVTIDTAAQEAAATLVSEAIGAGTPAHAGQGDTEELKKLTQELTALREYASSQQDRMRKLQDGYDWTILKNFCLRIIRCVDHLDYRINELIQIGDVADDLEEVRDELIFAMESSGVEQYRPDLHTPYRGSERELEVVPDRIDCNEPEMIDTIAEVVRPGYQYVVDENNIKIVRTAQVRLYGLAVAETVS